MSVPFVGIVYKTHVRAGTGSGIVELSMRTPDVYDTSNVHATPRTIDTLTKL